MRTMADSTNPFDIPTGRFQLVAGYVDGLYAWSDAGWERHKGSGLVQITVTGGNLDAQVADYEPGNLSLAQLVAWVKAKHARGQTPTVYFSLSLFGEINGAFVANGISGQEWLTWVADWNGQPNLEPGWTAHQYADSAMVGAHYDLSVAGDYWPGVDALPPPPATAGAAAGLEGWAGLVQMVDTVLPESAGELAVLSSGLDRLG